MGDEVDAVAGQAQIRELLETRQRRQAGHAGEHVVVEDERLQRSEAGPCVGAQGGGGAGQLGQVVTAEIQILQRRQPPQRQHCRL